METAAYIARGIASDPEAVRRLRLSLDYDLICEFAGKDAFFIVDEWVNKSLNFRDAKVRFDNPDKEEPDLCFDRWLPMADLSDLMNFHYPWLEYEYTDPIEEYAGEIAEHKFVARLNQIGKAFLIMEEFYKEGPKEAEMPAPPDGDYDEMDDEAWNEYYFERGVERDPFD